MTQEQERVCDALDWRVIVSEDEIELEKYSPAGEDFIFSITDMDDIPHGREARLYPQDIMNITYGKKFLYLKANVRVPEGSETKE